MALKVGELFATVSIDAKDFTGTISSMGDDLSALAGKAISLTAVLSAIGYGIKYNANVEELQTSFEVMTGSAEKAAEVMTTLQEIGAQTPYETMGLAQSVQLMMAYGMSADSAVDMITVLGDVAQGNQGKLDGFAFAYGQMFSANKVRLQEINQMINHGFNPLAVIAEKTGESMTDVYDRVSDGAVSVEEITNALIAATSEGGQFFGSMDRQSQTLKGQWATLKDEASMFWGDMVKPANNVLRDSILPGVTKAIGIYHDAFTEGGWGGLAGKFGEYVWKAAFATPMGMPDVPVELPNFQISNPQLLESDAMGIVNDFYQQLQNGMSKEQALDFMVTWSGTGSGADLQGELQRLYDQYFPSGAAEQVSIPVTPEIQQPETTTMPDIIDVPVNPTIEAPDVSATMTAAGTTAGQSYSDGMSSGIASSTAVTSAASALTGSIQSAITPAISTARLQGVGISGALGSGISTGSFAAFAAVNNLSSGLSGFLSNATSSASSSGLNFSLGLAGGIRAGRSAVISAATSVAQAAMRAVQSTLQIHSPSRVTESFGEYFSKGFALGIERNVRTVTGAASDMAHLAAAAVSIGNPGAGVRSNTVHRTSTTSVQIDYDRLADAMAQRPVNVDMDGVRVGRIVTRRQNQSSRSAALGLGKA